MNIKSDQERAEVYIKMRATRQFKENFKMCCEANGKDMTSVLDELVKEYMVDNMHKAIKNKGGSINEYKKRTSRVITGIEQ